MLYNMDFSLDYLQISQKSVSLHCVFHSIRFKQGVAPFFMPIHLES